MFISSYNTYISSSNTQNIKRDSHHKNDINQYGNKLFKINKNYISRSNSNLSPNYISSYKILANQKKLQNNFESSQQKEEEIFVNINKLISAKKAYTQNSLSFYSDTSLQQSSLEKTNFKIKNISTTQAVNTYIENENYYKVTA